MNIIFQGHSHSAGWETVRFRTPGHRNPRHFLDTGDPGTRVHANQFGCLPL